MKKYTWPILIILTGCSGMPQLFQTEESKPNKEAIKLMISPETVDKDVNVSIDVKNNQGK